MKRFETLLRVDLKRKNDVLKTALIFKNAILPLSVIGSFAIVLKAPNLLITYLAIRIDVGRSAKLCFLVETALFKKFA